MDGEPEWTDEAQAALEEAVSVFPSTHERRFTGPLEYVENTTGVRYNLLEINHRLQLLQNSESARTRADRRRPLNRAATESTIPSSDRVSDRGMSSSPPCDAFWKRETTLPDGSRRVETSLSMQRAVATLTAQLQAPRRPRPGEASPGEPGPSRGGNHLMYNTPSPQREVSPAASPAARPSSSPPAEPDDGPRTPPSQIRNFPPSTPPPIAGYKRRRRTSSLSHSSPPSSRRQIEMRKMARRLYFNNSEERRSPTIQSLLDASTDEAPGPSNLSQSESSAVSSSSHRDSSVGTPSSSPSSPHDGSSSDDDSSDNGEGPSNQAANNQAFTPRPPRLGSPFEYP